MKVICENEPENFERIQKIIEVYHDHSQKFHRYIKLEFQQLMKSHSYESLYIESVYNLILKQQ